MKTTILTVCLLCLIIAYSHAQLTVKDGDDNQLMTVDSDANVVIGTSQQRGSLSNMGIMGIGRTAWAVQQLAIENQIAGISGNREYCRGISINLRPTQTKFDQNTYDYDKSATSFWLSSQTGSDSPTSLAKLAGIRAYYGGGNQSSGSVDDAIGIELLPATKGASISSLYDILVKDDQLDNSPAPGKHWGLYIEHGGENYFGGPLGIGRDADTDYYMLDVDGAIRCYANVDDYALRCNGDSKTFGDSYIEGMAGIGQDPDPTAQVTIQNQVTGVWEGNEYCRGLAIFTKPQAAKYSHPEDNVSSGLFVSSQLGTESSLLLSELFGMKAYYGAHKTSVSGGSVDTVVGLSLRPVQDGNATIEDMYDIKINNDWMEGNVTGQRWGIYIEHSEDNYFGGALGLNTHPGPGYMLEVNGDAYTSGGWQSSGGDYAEWFIKEGQSKPGDLIGIDLETGKARKYQAGDKFIGIHSSDPAVIGNKLKNNTQELEQTHVLVGLLGQLSVNEEQITVKGNLVYTKDDKYVGIMLYNNKVFIGR